nr:uncharacterized protein LOC111982938 [Quercus suber]
MEATQSSSGSYAWQSILKGRDVLKRGAWRIGCGENVSVWNDAWLPSRNRPTMQSLVVEAFQDAKVRDLINPDSHKWETDLIKGLFTPQEVELILTTSSTNLGLNQALWKNIWDASVPNKVRNFLWRVCKNAIPTKKNLVQRKILTEGTCDHYRATPETALHALWECPKLSVVWEKDNQWSFRGNTSFTTFQVLVQHVIAECKDLESFGMLVWAIWYQRNQVRVSQKEFTYNQIGPLATQMLHDFVQVLPERQRQPTRTKDQQVRWQPPPTTKFKITFDGVVFKEEKRAGLGVVIRNHQGQVHASLTENVALPPSIMEVEALAAIRVVSFAVELGVSSIILRENLKNKAEISRLTLNQKEERHVEQLPTVIGGGLTVIRDPDIGFLAEIGAPVSVVPEELPPKLAQNGGVEGVDVVQGRRERI